MSLLDHFSHLFFPNLCCGCEEYAVSDSEFFCLQCSYDCPITTLHLEPENECLERLAGRLPLQHGAAMFRFTPGGKVQHLIHLIKYQGHRKAAERVGAAYGTMLPCSRFPRDGVLIPVPLHKQKKQQRGFNQSLHFAYGIAATSGWSISTNALVRVRDTKTQTAMTREERLENLHGAFALRDPTEIMERDIILVDDILTTGATLRACAGVLLNQCRSISFITIGLAV